MRPKRLVSTDIGNLNSRARSSTREVIHPSVVAVEQGAIRFDGFTSSRNLVIEFEGQKLAIGEAAYKLGRLPVHDMGSHRIEGDAYRQLFAASLVASLGQSSPLAVVASLPVKFYTGSRDRVKDWLSGRYDIGFNGSDYIFEIDGNEDMHVIPEGFGALCCLLLNRNGRVVDSELADMRVGVVDAGGRTVDFLFFDRLELIPTKSWGVDKAGMSMLWKQLDEGIQNTYRRSLDPLDLDLALHNGYFKQAGREIDITNEVEVASGVLANLITTEVNSNWDGANDVDLIIFVGGGAEFVFHLMPYAHKHLINARDHGIPSHMANVEGGFRFGLYRRFADDGS